MADDQTREGGREQRDAHRASAERRRHQAPIAARTPSLLLLRGRARNLGAVGRPGEREVVRHAGHAVARRCLVRAGDDLQHLERAGEQSARTIVSGDPPVLFTHASALGGSPPRRSHCPRSAPDADTGEDDGDEQEREHHHGLRALLRLCPGRAALGLLVALLRIARLGIPLLWIALGIPLLRISLLWLALRG